MAITEVGSGSQRNSVSQGAQSTTGTLAFPANVASGNLLIVAGSVFNAGVTITGVTDTRGTTYTVIQDSGSTNHSRYIAYGIAPSSGACTVTVTSSANGYHSFGIDEFTGVDATPLSVNGGSSTGTSTAPSDSITTLTAGELIIGCLGIDIGSGTVVITAGQTEIGQEGNANNFETYGASFQIAGAAGAYNQSWTLGASQTWRVLTASFEAEAVGSPQTITGSLYTNTTTFFTGAILGGSTHVFQNNVFQNNVFQMEAAAAFNASFSESAATSNSQTATVSATAARTETAATGDSQTATVSTGTSRTETVATSDSQTASVPNGAVMVQWEPSADPNVTGYFVYWDTVSHAGGVYTDYAFSADVLGNAAAQYLITGLQAGQTYFINISSHGPGGHDANESDLWGEVSDVASDLGLWQFLNGGLRYENQTTFFTGSIVQGGIGAFAETAATGDSQTAAISSSAARTETAATGDSQTSALSSSVTGTETAATADSQNAANSASATAAETAATGDTGSASLGGGTFTASFSDSAAAGDSQSSALSASATGTETAATSDTGVASLGGGTFIASFADSAASNDSQTAALSASATATETASTADSQTAANSASATAAETASTSETGVASLGGGTFIASFTESAGSVDSQSAGLTATATASDTAATGDSNTGLNGLAVSRTESTVISDSASGGVAATVSFGESVSIIDIPVATMAALVSASDIVLTGDIVAGVNSKLAQFAESAATGDSISSSLSTQIIPTLDWSRYHIKVKAKTRRIRIHL